MKRILFIINTMGRAGAERALLQLLRVLSEYPDYELSLLTIIPQGDLFREVPDSVKLLNRTHSPESVFSPKGRREISRYTIRAAFRHGSGIKNLGYCITNALEQKRRTGKLQPEKLLWRVLSDGAPRLTQTYDLSVAYLEGASAYYLIDHVQARKKAAFIHIDYVQAGYTQTMDCSCYDRMDRIFVVSKEVGRKFLTVYPECADRVFLFHNLLDVDGIRARAEEPGFTDAFDGYRLVTVGRLHYQKAYDLAIQACAQLRRDGYPVRWYVLGEGMEREALEKQIREAHLEQDFILMGMQSNPYPYIKGADLYVHATRFEGKSIAIEEAQILGKPIVASNCTGNTEQIQDGVDGILLDLTVDRLVHTIERVLDDPKLRETLQRNVSKKDFRDTGHMQNLIDLIEPSEKGR